MLALDQLRSALPEAAKDTRLNLGTVLAEGGPLNADQRWGTAYAVALATCNAQLARAIREAARGLAADVALADACAAATLMAMNNVYYRFRHRVGVPAYAQLTPRLRMNRLAQPSHNRVDSELFALAVSAYNDCEVCVQAHERAVKSGGLGEEHVHEAVRIAAVVAAVATALVATAAESPAGP